MVEEPGQPTKQEQRNLQTEALNESRKEDHAIISPTYFETVFQLLEDKINKLDKWRKKRKLHRTYIYS